MSLPRALDTAKFADARIFEILHIHEQVKNTNPREYGVKGLPRSLRRRTRSHNRYSHGKRPNRLKDEVIDSSGKEKMKNRKMRRKEKFSTYCEAWCGEYPQASGADGSEDIRRLPTHVFHAKRMTMSPKSDWNFILPEGAVGRGRGTRSFKHKLETGCIIHDSSYWCSIEFEMPKVDAEKFLSKLVGGSISDMPMEDEIRIDGVRLSGKEKAIVGPLDIICTQGSNSGIIRLIVWAHCAFLETVVEDIKAEESFQDGLLIGRLGRVDVRGPSSFQTLKKLSASPHTASRVCQVISDGNVTWIRQKCNESTCSNSVDDKSQNISIAEGLLNLVVMPSGKQGLENKPVDMLLVKKKDGYSIITNRECYSRLFKSISLSGVYITGQREWHWYHTLTKSRFYPDDYISSQCLHSQFCSRWQPDFFLTRLSGPCKDLIAGNRLTPVLIWVSRDGTLCSGNILCAIDNSLHTHKFGKMVIDRKTRTLTKGEDVMIQVDHVLAVGIVSTPKPYAIQAKFPSIGLIDSQYICLENRKKIKLWAYDPERKLAIPVHARPFC